MTTRAPTAQEARADRTLARVGAHVGDARVMLRHTHGETALEADAEDTGRACVPREGAHRGASLPRRTRAGGIDDVAALRRHVPRQHTAGVRATAERGSNQLAAVEQLRGQRQWS
jgi:hypothetical protein